jgi:hypothetical protein
MVAMPRYCATPMPAAGARTDDPEESEPNSRGVQTASSTT